MKQTSIQKLDVIANIFTIVGVSIATFFGGPFLSKLINRTFDPADFVMTIIFYSIIIGTTLLISVVIIRKLSEFVRQYQWVYFFILFLVVLIFIWIAIIVFPFFKYHYGNIFNVSYLLPDKASNSVVSITDFKISNKPDAFDVTGKVNLNSNTKHTDYKVLLYVKKRGVDHYFIYPDGKIEKVGYGKPKKSRTIKEYGHDINSNGTFLIQNINNWLPNDIFLFSETIKILGSNLDL